MATFGSGRRSTARRGRTGWVVAASTGLALSLLQGWAAPAALAQAGPGAAGAPLAPGEPESSDQPAAQPPPASIATSLGPFGDPGGIRASLAAAGVTYSLTYIGETLGVVSGGQRRGAIYEGRLDAQLDLDLSRIAGWTGATVHANAYGIHGHGLSRYYLSNLLVTSGIEALSSVRLYELWFEQALLDDKVAVRAGQLAMDTEFIVSQYAGLFVNATFGFPAIAATALPNGGPAYPLATPGARVKLMPGGGWTFLGAVFNGAPAGNGPGDPQVENRNGVEFRARDPALLAGEVAYAYGQAADALPGTVKVGGWHHLGRFPSLRQALPDGSGALLLADPAGSGAARRLRGNSGIYGVVDQALYRVSGTDQGIGFFARLAGAPSDRNLVDLYADGGFTFKGLVPGRPDDTAGVALSYARISRGARGFDADLLGFTPGLVRPVRSSEAALEVTYQAQVVPGFTLQPDLQYIRRPGGGIVNPRSAAGETVRDAVVAGLRASIRY